MLPLLGGVVVFVVLALVLIAERTFETGRSLRERPRQRPRQITSERERETPPLPRG